MKRSTVGRFASGSVGLTLPTGERFSADTDVCAETWTGRYEDSLGNRLSPSIITISMPYRDSYIRIEAAFRQISNGQYDVVAFEPFIQGRVNDITISGFISLSFAAQYGGDSLAIRFGTLQVSNYIGSSVTLSADLITAAGLPVKFTANAKLQPRF
jgi:hypothetical protein